MKKVILFADHAIGERLVRRAVRDFPPLGLSLAGVVTTVDNADRWWRRVQQDDLPKEVFFTQYDPNAPLEAAGGDMDYMMLLSWKHVLPAELLRRARAGVINMHYSLLPKYRGVYPVNWAIINGEKETGVTFHWVTEEVDAGPPILQRSIQIMPDDIAMSLAGRLDDLAESLFGDLITLLATTAPQAPVHTGAGGSAYYSRRRFVETNQLDLEKLMTAGAFIDLLRGKSFLPHTKNLFFTDPDTGEKIYVDILLSRSPDAD